MSVLICAECTARYAVGAERCPQCGANSPREEHEQRLNIHSLNVECQNQACAAAGIRRRVPLNAVAPGVLARPALLCATCGLIVAEIANEPPPQDQEDSVPKTTVHTGPSNAAADLADGEPEQPEPTDTEGSEDVSPGTNSSTSSEKQPTSPTTSEAGSPKPARTTASRSGKARTGSSTAPSTDGDPTAPTSDDES